MDATAATVERTGRINLLEHYIINVISEEKKISPHGTEYINAKMIVDCYGVEEQKEHLFLPSEWEQVKKDGYYLA